MLEFAHEGRNFISGWSRVEQIVLHPFDLEEYLMALGLDTAAAELNKIPIAGYAHETLLNHFHDYAVIGGMPEAIKRFVGQKTMANLPEIYDNLWQSYRDDVEKYAKNPKERNVIRYIIERRPLKKTGSVLRVLPIQITMQRKSEKHLGLWIWPGLFGLFIHVRFTNRLFYLK